MILEGYNYVLTLRKVCSALLPHRAGWIFVSEMRNVLAPTDSSQLPGLGFPWVNPLHHAHLYAVSLKETLRGFCLAIFGAGFFAKVIENFL